MVQLYLIWIIILETKWYISDGNINVTNDLSQAANVNLIPSINSDYCISNILIGIHTCVDITSKTTGKFLSMYYTLTPCPGGHACFPNLSSISSVSWSDLTTTRTRGTKYEMVWLVCNFKSSTCWKYS